jgi:flagellar basal-body rod protein FlgB
VSLFDNTELALTRAMSGANLRQQLLANNLANAETPGYQRQDVDFHAQLSQAMQTGDPNAIESVQFSPQTDNQVMRADGNGVDIDVESANIAKNALEYQSLVSVAQARIQILKYAMGSS